MSTESLHHTVLLNEAVDALLAQSDEPVSYTHLTLPTIYSV